MTTRALIPLVAPCITQHDRDYMQERIEGGLLEDESEVTLFEEAFAEYVGCAGAVAVCSGTVALRLAGLRGSIVIPTFACIALERPSLGERLRCEYLDSAFDVAAQRLTMIHRFAREPSVLVHMFGGATVTPDRARIEDWTLSLGADLRLNGRVGVCSTHASKMMSTGCGGVVFSDDWDLLGRVRGDAAEFRMSATQAALGVAQLEQLESFIATRRAIAEYYTTRFEGNGFEVPAMDCGSVFFRYIVAVDDPFAAVAELANRGVEAGHGVNPLLHRLAGLDDSRFPGACRDADRLLSVPVHPSLSDVEVEFVADQVVAVCGR